MIRRLLVCCLLAIVAPAFAQDTVYRRAGGKSEAGTISDMKKDYIALTVNGAEVKIPSNEVARISCEGEPNVMSDVRLSVSQNNFRAALEDLKTIDVKKVERDVAKQEVEFYIAYCTAKLAMAEGGDKDAADALLKEFYTVNKNSFHFFTIYELSGDLAASAGKFADATKVYTLLAKNAPWADMKLRAAVESGRVLMAQKQFPEAQKQFEAVLADPAKTAETEPLKQMAKVGQAACWAETGKTKEAIEQLIGKEGVISLSDPKNNALMARAYNALGTAQLKAGDKKAALLAFLHTDLLYFGEADPHAEALYHLSKLWAEMNKSDRATQAISTLKSRYAGSVWSR